MKTSEYSLLMYFHTYEFTDVLGVWNRPTNNIWFYYIMLSMEAPKRQISAFFFEFIKYKQSKLKNFLSRLQIIKTCFLHSDCECIILFLKGEKESSRISV